MHDVYAVIYLPPGIAYDGALAARCVDHILERGYRLHAVAREWHLVWQLLKTEAVQVVVFARREHVELDWLPRFEVAGERPADHPRPMVRRNEGRPGGGFSRNRKTDRPRHVIRPRPEAD